MNRYLTFSIAALLCGSYALSTAASGADGASADTAVEHIVVALETDDFQLEETDLSDLAVGDASTIVTENGRTVDLLRTADGVEIYLDGELIGTDGTDEEQLAALGDAKVLKTVEVVCESEGECEKTVLISDEGDEKPDALEDGAEIEKVIIIRKSETGSG